MHSGSLSSPDNRGASTDSFLGRRAVQFLWTLRLTLALSLHRSLRVPNRPSREEVPPEQRPQLAKEFLLESVSAIVDSRWMTVVPRSLLVRRGHSQLITRTLPQPDSHARPCLEW